MGLDNDSGPDRSGFKNAAQREEEAKQDEDEDIATLLDIKRWKYNGQFATRFLSTCPQPPTIDCRSDRPFEEAEFVAGNGNLRQTKKHISEQSKAYLNRIDTYRLNEE